MNYGILDGKQIPWDNYKIFGYMDTVLWLLLLALAIIKKTYVYKIIKKVSIVLILVQTAYSFITWFQAPEQPDWNKYSINEESKYKFSKKKNVIILVLDTFQTDIFQEIVNESPEIKKVFNGFTYYRNSVGGYPTTYPSIPLLLTGSYYNNSVPMQKFLKNAYSSASIPLILKQNGYQVDLYPVALQTIYYDESIASNLVRSGNISGKLDSYRKESLVNIYKVTMFKYIPHIIKKHYYYILTPEIKNDLEFANDITSESMAIGGKPIFKYFHLRGVHPPFSLNDRLVPEKLEYSRNGYKIQAKAALEITKKFLTSLKKNGIYDNSMIFIVGDHGLGTFGINLSASGYTESGKITKLTSNYTIASGIPLILVKPFASTEDMKVSDAPVSLSDIPKTITSELGLTVKYPGRSMFTIKESDIRERRFLAYQWEHEYWDKAYLPSMQEYIISGFSWLNQSWRPTYRKFTSEGIQSTQPDVYQFGSKIQFGDGGNAEQYQGQGWSQHEKGFTWTDGKSASLVIPVSQSQTALTLKAVLKPFVNNKVDRQRIIININGEKLGEWDIRSSGEYQIEIPKKIINGSFLGISFELPDATSPSELKISKDLRTLGIAVQSITIYQKANYKYGAKIQFGEGGNAEHYQDKGWSQPEKDFTWTDGKNANFIIPISQPHSDFIIKATLFPFVAKGVDKQKVNIYVNKRKLGEWIVRTNGDYTIEIPQDYVIDSKLVVSFELPDAVSPKVLKISNDSRNLGIAMVSVSVLEKK
ncbi:MAG: sulfatase-like hydrolase/transferase [Carboxydocellales bacterium]